MYNRKYIFATALSIILLVTVTGRQGVRSQFLIDKEDPTIEDYTEEKKSRKRKKDLKIMARNIEASRIPGIPNAIMITWDVDPAYTDEFIIGRSRVVTDTKKRALEARTVRTVSARQRGVLIDSNLGPGSYYYVILESPRVVRKEIALAPNVNYTTRSITIKEVKGPVVVKKIAGFRARLIGDGVILLTWEKIRKKGYTYTIYRSTSVLDSYERLSKAEKIARLSDEGQYIDQNLVSGGTYFYAVTFRYLNNEEDRRLAAGENYITEGIYVKPPSSKKKSEPYRILMIRAAVSGDNVIISWDYTGKSGNKYLRLYRTRRFLKSIDAVNDENVIADVDITAGRYIDKNAPAGRLYYGLAPYKDAAGGSFTIRRGINIIRNHVTKGSPEENKDKRDTIPEKNETAKQDEEIDLRGEGHGLPLIVTPDREEKKNKIIPARGKIRDIIDRTFLKGHYREAIKELQVAAKKTDNERERALARLFIGRSYIELGRYRKALALLVAKDVEKHYSREAAFWREFAMLRVR